MKNDEKALGHIFRREADAKQVFDDASKKFEVAVAANPAQAIEWNAEKMVAAQTAHVWWQNVASVAKSKGVVAAVEYGRDLAERSLDGFFGGSSTCPWHNACRRAEATVYHRLLEQEVKYLERRLAVEVAG
jgi:hypothetical protein